MKLETLVSVASSDPDATFKRKKNTEDNKLIMFPVGSANDSRTTLRACVREIRERITFRNRKQGNASDSTTKSANSNEQCPFTEAVT